MCTGKHGGCLDLTLEIYETKTLYKSVLWDSSFLHWKSGTHKPMSVWIYKKMQFNDLDDAIVSMVEQRGFDSDKHKVYKWDDETRTAIN